VHKAKQYEVSIMTINEDGSRTNEPIHIRTVDADNKDEALEIVRWLERQRNQMNTVYSVRKIST
jgi:hypothetical protein